jgi:hypothetical protein
MIEYNKPFAQRKGLLDASRKPREALLKPPPTLDSFGLHFFPSMV